MKIKIINNEGKHKKGNRHESQRLAMLLAPCAMRVSF